MGLRLASFAIEFANRPRGLAMSEAEVRIMNRFLVIGLAFCAAISPTPPLSAADPAAATAPSVLLARVQFAGQAAIAVDTNGTVFKSTWELPVSQDLLRESLDRLSGGLRRLSIQDQTHTNLVDAKTRAVFDDLVAAEWLAEWRGAQGQGLDWALAVALKPDRVAAWQSAFNAHSQEAQGAAPRSVTIDGVAGSQADWGKELGAVVLLQSGDWTVVAGGAQSTARSILDRIKATKRPAPPLSNAWFSADVNLPKLGAWVKFPGMDRWPHVQCTLLGRGEYLRLQARFGFKDLGLGPLPPWQIPTATIKEDPKRVPLASLTAARGFGPWLEATTAWKRLGLGYAPPQGYIWSQSQVPFQTFYALQLPDVTNALHQVHKNLPVVLGTNIAARGTARIDFDTNRSEVLWKGLPLFAPTLRPADDAHYVLGGFFPMSRATNAPPDALLNQITSRTNLLFFEWEMQGVRIPQCNVLWQMVNMATGSQDFRPGSTAFRWLNTVATNLTESGTEVVLESPQVISMKHTSPLGLNSLGVVAFMRWLDNPLFPAFTPPPRARPKALVPELAPLRRPKP